MRALSFIILFIVLPVFVIGQIYFNKYLEPVGVLNPNPSDLYVDEHRLLIQSFHIDNKTIISEVDMDGTFVRDVIYENFGNADFGLDKIKDEFVMWGKDENLSLGLRLKFIDFELLEKETTVVSTIGEWNYHSTFCSYDDSIYVLCIYRDSTTNLLHGVVKGIDSQGSELWDTDIHDGENFVNIYQIGVNEKEQIVVSSRFDDGPNDVVGVITYLNETGTILRQKKMSEEIWPGTRVTFVELSNGEIICGTVVDKRQDWDYIQNEWFEQPTKYYWLSGDNLQEQKDTIYINSKFERPGGEKLWKGNGDYFFIYGHIWFFDEDQTYGMLKKVDNDGNILWSRRYQHEDFTGDNNFHGIEHIQEMPDGSIYTAGSARFTGGRNHIWIMHLDENGCLGDDCGEVVITDVEDVSTVGKEEISVFPNPASEVLTVDNLELNIDYAYVITDAAGSLFIKGDLSHDKLPVIDITSLANGLYYIELKEKDTHRKVTLKFVVK